MIEALQKQFSNDLINFGIFDIERNDSDSIMKNGLKLNKVPSILLYTLKYYF